MGNGFAGMSVGAEFMGIIRNATPAEIRTICARVEADPRRTPACLALVAVMQDYADQVQADLERMGIDCGAQA